MNGDPNPVRELIDEVDLLGPIRRNSPRTERAIESYGASSLLFEMFAFCCKKAATNQIIAALEMKSKDA